MRRSPMRPEPPPRPPRAALVPLTREVVYAPPAAAAARPKFAYVRSPALLAACRELPCQHCGVADGTVVAAHSNWAVHGKGRSIKASDPFCAAMCHCCHAAIDQGSTFSEAERKAIWFAAHRKTVRALVRRRLWPAGVAVPDVQTCPF